MKFAWNNFASAGLLAVVGGALYTTIAASQSIPQSGPEQAVVETSGTLGTLEKMPHGRLSKSDLEALMAVGEALFTAKFTTGEGAGRPAATQAIIPTKRRSRSAVEFSRTAGLDAHACSSCHNEPVTGGAGDFVTNVFVSEGFVNADFDSTDPQFSNERGSNHLFGAGLVELLAREMSADLANIRSMALREARAKSEDVTRKLETKGVFFGSITAHADGLVDLSKVEGVDSDLVVRPFSQKGVMTSLRQFTVNAANHHHGIQADERFGKRWTGERDFDGDLHNDELQPADVSALVAFQATLPPPVPTKASRKLQSGADVFQKFGCETCHRKALPLTSLAFSDPGNLDVAGTLNTSQVKEAAVYDLALLDWAKELPRNEKGEVLVPLFGDLKRHTMTDRSIEALGNELLSQRFVDRTIFMTAELWGVGSTAPYGHRNDFTTLNEIILAHGGDGRAARDAYRDAPVTERQALVNWLKSLTVETRP